MLAIGWGILVGIALSKLAHVAAEQWMLYQAWKRAQPYWIKSFAEIPKFVPAKGGTLILSNKGRTLS